MGANTVRMVSFRSTADAKALERARKLCGDAQVSLQRHGHRLVLLKARGTQDDHRTIMLLSFLDDEFSDETDREYAELRAALSKTLRVAPGPTEEFEIAFGESR